MGGGKGLGPFTNPRAIPYPQGGPFERGETPFSNPLAQSAPPSPGFLVIERQGLSITIPQGSLKGLALL